MRATLASRSLAVSGFFFPVLSSWELSVVKANPILYNVIYLSFVFLYFFQKQKMVKIKNKNKKARDARPKNSFSLKPSPGKIVYRRRHLITLHHCKILTDQYVLLIRVLVLLSLKWYSRFLPPVQPPEDKSRHFNQSLFLSSKSRTRSGIYIKFEKFRFLPFFFKFFLCSWR